MYKLDAQLPVTLTGHRDVLQGVFFSRPLVKEEEAGCYTVSRDGAIFEWRYCPKEAATAPEEHEVGEGDKFTPMNLTTGKWGASNEKFLYANCEINFVRLPYRA